MRPFIIVVPARHWQQCTATEKRLWEDGHRAHKGQTQSSHLYGPLEDAFIKLCSKIVVE